jgi:hypothetical protein
VGSASILVGFSSVAVGAAYFALGYFSYNALQGHAPAICVAYIKVLVGSVVVVEL